MCARRCRADRALKAGRCGETEEIRVARAALHMWEEPCISGTKGSGTIFFEGCPLGCAFCQNRSIAFGRKGGSGAKAVTEERLAGICLELQEKGAHNINLVTPTHYVPQIIRAVRAARENGLAVPVVYNTGSYETVETVRSLAGTVDVWLPDLKFFDPAVSNRYADAPDYFTVASAAIREMTEQVCRRGGSLSEDGMLTRGIIVRHMILPGHTKDSKAILRYLHEEYGRDVTISIMNQYTPMPGIEKRCPELARKVTRREYDRVIDYALSIGISEAFIQEGGTAAESFIPAFDGEGV